MGGFGTLIPKPISFISWIAYNSSLGRSLIDILGFGFDFVGFDLGDGDVDGMGASMRDGAGLEVEGGNGGGSSMMRRESTHVGGLCSRIDKPRVHLDEMATKKDSRHRRPMQDS